MILTELFQEKKKPPENKPVNSDTTLVDENWHFGTASYRLFITAINTTSVGVLVA
ncbi:hypothetical protein RM545_03790 [Zunongwangia sp. F260]|uniref:Uncharacterized protein n=1 Tax=Autumnicola lenta TaxID=3075593 RepID=A0ABU3CHH1_9FLAO|nr:hypothetical protein [Zunongwangia sp. F260]MDT0645799.1 hypothetical protein [Zunongwangia sp. F260]